MCDLNIQVFGEGRPLVLFHGWGFDSQIWLPLLPEFVALPISHQIMSVDLPGHGQTPVMSWEAFKTQLLQQLPTQFTVAGWSLGGLFAARLAIEAPDRVCRLINIASSPCFMRADSWPGIEHAVLDEFYERFQDNPQQTRQHFVRAQIQKKWQQHDTGFQGLEEGLMALKHWDFRKEIQDCAMPVSFLFGRLDTIVPHQVMTTMQLQYPQFHYVLLSRAAHMPFLSHPQQFMQELRAILC